ncbi:MAG: hypothetical protein AB7F25_02570 [Deferribacterales bacterium]
MPTWRAYIRETGIKIISDEIECSYEAVRAWANDDLVPCKKNTAKLCSIMQTRLKPDEFEIFKKSLVSDIITPAI